MVVMVSRNIEEKITSKRKLNKIKYNFYIVYIIRYYLIIIKLQIKEEKNEILLFFLVFFCI